MRKTKIVCTIGPACETKPVLEEMAEAGMNIARLNFSHSNHNYHKFLLENIKEVSKNLGKQIGILQDLQGPRIRIGRIRSSKIILEKGEKVILVPEEDYDIILSKIEKEVKILPLTFNFIKYVKVDDSILINNGLVRLKVIEKHRNSLLCKVILEGEVSAFRGINLPDSDINISAITSKDVFDLEFGLKNKVDFIALSFVSSAKDIKKLKDIIKAKAKRYHLKVLPKIIAKIETKKALENLDEILDASDGVMVARGDLGLEIDEYKVPLIQKKIIDLARKNAKPSIVATQMLESMVQNPIPTRAEVSDVATAVMNGADCVMLSEETSVGKYPEQTVAMMGKIIDEVESSGFSNYFNLNVKNQEFALAISSCNLAKELKAKFILASTLSGTTPRIISALRPSVPIVAIAENKYVQRQLTMIWGVTALVVKRCRTIEELISRSVNLIKRKRLVFKGDKIIILSGEPVGHIGVNMIKVQEIK